MVDRKNLPDYEPLTRRARNTSEPVRGIYRKTVALSFELRYSATGGRKGQGGFSLNGQLVRDAVDLSPTLVRLPSGGLSVGINRRSPISARYRDRGTFRYSGQISTVRIEPGRQPADTPMLLDESAIQARMRAAAAKTH